MAKEHKPDMGSASGVSAPNPVGHSATSAYVAETEVDSSESDEDMEDEYDQTCIDDDGLPFVDSTGRTLVPMEANLVALAGACRAHYFTWPCGGGHRSSGQSGGIVALVTLGCVFGHVFQPPVSVSPPTRVL